MYLGYLFFQFEQNLVENGLNQPTAQSILVLLWLDCLAVGFG